MNSDLFRQEMLDYQSASNSQFGKPTGVLPPTWSRITGLLAVFMIALFVFLFTIDFARKETVRGKLRIDGAEARVHALEAGLITKVFVEDGQILRAGDPIAEITTDRYMSDGAALSEATLAQLQRELELLEQQRIVVEQTASLKVQETEQQLADAKRRERELIAQRVVVRKRFALAQQRASDAETFLEEGLIAEPQVHERQEAAASLEQTVLQLDAQIGAADATQDAAILAKRQVQANLSRDLTEVDQRAEQISAQMQQTAARTVHIVRASIDGKLTALQARLGEQAVIDRPLAVILPEEGLLYAEVYIPSRAIGFVAPGQEVKLQYDAFPYQKFGVALGIVSSVANTAQPPQELGVASQTGEPVYRVSIDIEGQSVPAFDNEFPLQVGMELTADIVLEDRQLIEWLLEPLMSRK